jgi:DNA-binding transcriptional LysR family regulator
MDKLKAMQTVVSIADSGSLTAAAESLDASLPAVVRTLAALEAHLGVRLFNRTTRRLSLTDEGRGYIESCRRLLADIQDTETALSVGAIEPSGSITVTASVLFGQRYVAPSVTRFVQHYDKMRVNLQLHDRVVNLLEENIDVGIRIGKLEDQSLVAQHLGNVRRMVVATPAYLKKHEVPRHPRDLLKANCICMSGSSAPWWTFMEKGKMFDVPVTGNLEFNQVAPAAEACVAGLGFGMFISYQVADYIAQGKLKIVLAEFEPPPRPVHIVYPHARLLPARTRAFIEWIRQDLKLPKSPA